jgi:hypothetical protein
MNGLRTTPYPALVKIAVSPSIVLFDNFPAAPNPIEPSCHWHTDVELTFRTKELLPTTALKM